MEFEHLDIIEFRHPFTDKLVRGYIDVNGNIRRPYPEYETFPIPPDAKNVYKDGKKIKFA